MDCIYDRIYYSVMSEYNTLFAYSWWCCWQTYHASTSCRKHRNDYVWVSLETHSLLFTVCDIIPDRSNWRDLFWLTLSEPGVCHDWEGVAEWLPSEQSGCRGSWWHHVRSTGLGVYTNNLCCLQHTGLLLYRFHAIALTPAPDNSCS